MRILPCLLAAALAACATALAAPPDDEGAAPAPGGAEALLTYAGRVVDEDGRPVAGAIVWADDGAPYQVIKEWTEFPWRRCVPDPLVAADVGPGTVRGREPSGADGRFRVEGVRPPAGEGWVVAVHADRVPVQKDAKGVAAVGGIVDVGDVTLPTGRSVRAFVARADGSPAPGAWVVARPAESIDGQGNWWSEETPGAIRVARAAADGTCTLRGLRAGKYRVGAFTDTSAPVVQEIDRAATDVRLTLAGGATVRVEVVTRGTSAPIAGARVRIDPVNETGGWSMPGPPPLGVAATDASGVVVFPGLDEHPEYAIVVVPPDFASNGTHHPGPFSVHTVAKPGDTAKVALDAPVEFRVVVQDALSKGRIAGARVKARPVWDRYDSTGGSPIDVDGERAEDGVVVFRTIRAGPWTFDAWAPDHLPARVGPFDVRGGNQVADPVLLAPATATVTGRVIERSTGRGIAGAQIETYEWIEFLNDGQRTSAASSAGGAFVVSKLFGDGYPLRAEIRAAGFVPEFVVRTKESRAADLGTIEMVRAATIRGRVTAKDGKPMGQVQVIVHRWPFERPGLSKSEPTWTATTDADGRYAVSALRPGDYVVEGQPRSAPIRLAEGATSDCDLVR